MTRQSTEDVHVPDILADVLRRTAAGVPADPPGLDEVRRRHRKRQPNYGFPPGTIGVVQLEPLEVTAAGEVVAHEIPADRFNSFHILGDGRIVTLEWSNPPDDQWPDSVCGPNITDYLRLIRLSPDGSRLAFAYRTDGPATLEPHVAKFAVIDLPGPALRLREVVQSVPPSVMNPGPWGGFAAAAVGGADRLSVYYPAGIAWSDDSTVRFAWLWLPDDLDRVASIDEVLNVRTYTVR